MGIKRIGGKGGREGERKRGGERERERNDCFIKMKWLHYRWMTIHVNNAEFPLDYSYQYTYTLLHMILVHVHVFK